VKRQAALVLFLSAVLALAGPARAQTANSSPKNFRLIVDGGEAPGVAGFAIDFERTQDLAYSIRKIAAPGTSPKLTLTLTPKGLNAFLAWLNEAGAGGTVTSKTIEVQSLDNEGVVLVHWRMENAIPTAITQLSSGVGTSVTAAVVLSFDKLTLVKAKAD
jgi:hypothetical protein